jgi:class 3 adenylate cyclase
VGLHSGPVTAGVLRGQKARFQLFGDSVNTAARMESNGVKGKIHVSQATADELIKSGKEAWITPCEEKIHAKGKGFMQTYFVQVAGPKSSMTSRTRATSALVSSVSNEGADDDPSEQNLAPRQSFIDGYVEC